MDNRFVPLKVGEDLFTTGEGVYLYWDPLNQVWVRSGKVAGRNFQSREREHHANARSGKIVSGFYASYASRDISSDYMHGEFTGVHYEDLQMYSGVSWVRTNSHNIVNMIIWPDNTISAMKRSNKWRGTRDLPDGVSYKTDFTAYLFELVYDLLLDQSNCVSEGPGFEGPIDWYC